MKHTLLIICLLLLAGTFTTATAATAATEPTMVNLTELPTSFDNGGKELKKQTKALKKEQRRAKRAAKYQKFMGKQGVDFADPVEKWMWFWIFSWGGALIFTLIAAPISGGAAWFFWFISTLLWIFGTVALVIWLVNKFS